jgi:hypothetical protein
MVTLQIGQVMHGNQFRKHADMTFSSLLKIPNADRIQPAFGGGFVSPNLI